jgi:hypothetical protein
MFRVAPPLELKKPEAIFRHKVLRMLLSKGKITEEMTPSPASSSRRGMKRRSGGTGRGLFKKYTRSILWSVRNVRGHADHQIHRGSVGDPGYPQSFGPMAGKGKTAPKSSRPALSNSPVITSPPPAESSAEKKWSLPVNRQKQPFF